MHAASLENQFVASGYSYNNQFGNAIFTNDFVLAGPTGDPAGVGAERRHTTSRRRSRTSRPPGNGRPKATFFTRGGTTTASGTTVEEHQIWALVAQPGPPAREPRAVRRERRRRRRHDPDQADRPTASRQPCPDSGTVARARTPPTWYFDQPALNQARERDRRPTPARALERRRTPATC